ncbi:MAG: hypothetical protein Q7R66_18045, partial [Undibacterium sp.]|nr:hypothetical protein [Undibacterium sp.]
MVKLVDFTLAQREKALENWLLECKTAFNRKFPKIDFDSEHWPIRTLYQTEQLDWHFTESTSAFKDEGKVFKRVLRCLVAERMLAGQPKSLSLHFNGYRLLDRVSAGSLYELTVAHCRVLEDHCLSEAQKIQSKANHHRGRLIGLQSTIEHMASKGVIARLGYVVSGDTLKKLSVIAKRQARETKALKAETIDRKIEALNDAVAALLDNDPRLDALDRIAICTLIILMCAPSRINEVLCMAVDDHVTVEGYAHKEVGRSSEVHSAHQMLLITMKGSKGASWSAKPALLFMIDLFHFAIRTIKRQGERSRLLVEWYSKNPRTLYLPPHLEHLRGRNLTRHDLDSIVGLRDTARAGTFNATTERIFHKLKSSVFKAENPKQKTAIGGM